MEQKEFTVKQIAAFKRIAMNVDATVNKKNKLKAKKTEIEAELAELYEELELMEAPVVKKTGGYRTEDLFIKVITPTGKLDAKGNIIKTTKYELRYPETFLPPFQPEALEEGEIVDETPIEETETTAAEAAYNPISSLID